MKVTVIADTLSPVTRPTSPLWVRSSPTHDIAARFWWNSGELLPDQLTLFRSPAKCSPERACADILDSVLLHHPEWTECEVVGAPLTTALKQAISAAGAVSFAVGPNGFTARRQTPTTPSP